jgi:hypothetical protein
MQIIKYLLISLVWFYFFYFSFIPSPRTPEFDRYPNISWASAVIDPPDSNLSNTESGYVEARFASLLIVFFTFSLVFNFSIIVSRNLGRMLNYKKKKLTLFVLANLLYVIISFFFVPLKYVFLINFILLYPVIKILIKTGYSKFLGILYLMPFGYIIIFFILLERKDNKYDVSKKQFY